jgi:pyruvate,water dikinase
MTQEDPFVVWLDDAQVESRSLGGKGASLLELSRGGFPVPPGFVLSAAAYQRFADANRLDGAIDSLLRTPDLRVPKVAREAVAGLADLLDASVLPDDLQDALAQAHAALQRRGVRTVAARSSALSEDGLAASSAGLYETYLNLRDLDAVSGAVRQCYASLWSYRAVQYRAFKGLSGPAEAMAVVVMALVPAEVAGVAFTANPVTADRDQIVINASWGLGEAVVSGRVTPDTFVLQKQSGAIVSREIAEKCVEVIADPAGLSGTVTRDVNQGRAARPALSDDEAAQLTELCSAIEAQYGRPMDIEWAFAGGRLFVLQARPITSAV